MSFWGTVSYKEIVLQKQGFMFELIIVLLTVQWLLSFFGQSIFPAILHTGGFIYMLSALIVFLIVVKSLSQYQI